MSNSHDLFGHPQVFLSYSTEDDGLARRIRDFLEKKVVLVWQDVTHMDPGEGINRQIFVTISQVKCLLVLLTCHSKESKWVKEEIRLARQEGVFVLPVIWDQDVNLEDLPSSLRFLSKISCINLHIETEWDRLTVYLQAPHQVIRVPMMAPKFDGFVERNEVFSALKSAVLKADGMQLALPTALVGAGGFGKTWLAMALCHDPEILERFDDGILWVDLGEESQDLLQKLGGVIRAVKKDEDMPSSLEFARARLRDLLRQRDVLMVIDDVRSSKDLEPFLDGGQEGQETVQRLITTRNIQVLPPNIRDIKVDVMQKGEAINLLTAGLSTNARVTERIKRLIKQCGYWPPLLSSVNGYLFRSVQKSKKSLVDALEQAEKQLEGEGLAGFNLDVSNNLHLFMRLSEDKRERFLELAVFPSEIEIPIHIIHRLWKKRGWKEYQGNNLLQELSDFSLLQRLDCKAGVVQLYAIFFTHLCTMPQEKLKEVHGAFLDSFHDWHHTILPPEDIAKSLEETKYIWHYVRYHIKEAGRCDDWFETFRN